jgi:tetratricopeptide (TPR) repeat protein
VARLRRRKAEDYYEEAMRLLQAQYYAATLEATDKAIGIEPGHAQAHQLRGEAPTGLNRHDEALDAYRQASKPAPPRQQQGGPGGPGARQPPVRLAQRPADARHRPVAACR